MADIQTDAGNVPVYLTKYKIFTAFIGQIGTGDPIIRELQNSLGGPVVAERIDVGNYKLSSNGLFTLGKTFIPNFFNFKGPGSTAIPLVDNSDTLCGYYLIYPDFNTPNNIYINTIGTDFINKEWSSLLTQTDSSGSDMSELSIDIKVY